jgi:hypothetical protein
MGNRGKAALILALALLAGACRKSDETAATASVQAAPPAVTINPPVNRTAQNDCPHTGLWARCHVERRLRQSGFVAKRLDEETPKRPGFSVKPIAYSLGRSRVEIFLYETAADLAKDMAALDTVLAVPRGSTATPWEATPTLVRSGNLAAVLLASSPQQAERFMNAITAGAPQPGSPR